MDFFKGLDFTKLTEMGASFKAFIDGRSKVDAEIIARLDRIEKRQQFHERALKARGIIDDLFDEMKPKTTGL